MQSDTSLTLRLPKNLHTQLKAAAMANERSLNSYIVMVLKQYQSATTVIPQQVDNDLDLDFSVDD